jgi:hypothetical protein
MLYEDQLQYINEPREILRALKTSLETGKVIGILAISLGPSLVMTAVEAIMEIKNDMLIVLKETDLLGLKLPEEQILLSEIVRVHPFRSRFDDPFHARLREKYHS